ncbi:hypothetical protein CDD80_1477 [Ophiocordyceps camponoti-rufipedis]|uniref:Uncharacterized protein n=1 Tax=Ophiocordyceps camponoti-rufipedis TaxID=2004952 RepID=A0A2C5ZHG5_9HYPO|nr:hypothetical protein CDD80_1477 [Ophiocordyceps camponoti-rufipedis]
MSPPWWLLRVISRCENLIVDTILRQPGFHRAVGRIHRVVEGRIRGGGEEPGRGRRFLRYFFDEVKNQIRGRPTEK